MNLMHMMFSVKKFGIIAVLILASVPLYLIISRQISSKTDFVADRAYCRQFSVNNCPFSCEVGGSCGWCLDVICREKWDPVRTVVAKGEINVVFKPGIEDSKIYDLLTKYNLSPKSKEVFRTFSEATFKSADDNLVEYAAKINESGLSYISNAEVFGQERANVEPWILVKFTRRVNRSEIIPILNISPNLYFEEVTFLGEKISVPQGQENKFVDILKSEPIVYGSSLIYVGEKIKLN